MSLKQIAFKGASWSLVGAIATAVIHIMRPAILTRFLEKADFGLMAILMLVLGFSQIFSDLGVSVALFSTKNITRREYSSLYWVGIITGIVLYSLVAFSSKFVAWFYDIPELTYLIPLIGLDLVISIAGRQFQIFRQKNMEFKTLAKIDIASALVSFILAIWLAYERYGVYSLIYSALAASTFKTTILILSGIKSHPISFCIDFKINQRFYKIGLFQTGAQVLDYIASQIDIIIIGKLLSTSDLGVYNLIKQLIIRPYGLINSVITRVSIPILASLNDNLVKLKEKYLEMIKLVGIINIPMYAMIALFAEEIINLIYGPSYLSATPYLQILCLWGAGAAIINSASTLIVILGRTDLGFIWTIVRVLTNPLFIIIGSFYGLTGIAWANSFCCLCYIGLYHKVLIAKVLKEISFRSYVYSFIDLFIIALIIFIALYLFKINFLVSYTVWFNVPILIIAFLTFFFLANPKIFKYLRNLSIRSG